MVGILLLVLLGVASFRVWVSVVRRWRANQPALDLAPRCPSPWLGMSALLAGLYVGVLVLSHTESQFKTLPQVAADENDAPSRTESPLTVTITDVHRGTAFGAIEILIAIVVLTGGFQASLESVGLRLVDLRRQLTEGTLAFLASFGPVFLVLLATYALRTEENQHPYLKLLREDPSPVTFGWLVLAAVVITPVREELLFRVMLQDGLARRIGAAPAIGIVAVLFCYVHGFPDSLALIPLALILGYLYEQRQSAVAVIVAHALFNLANISILLSRGPN